MNHRNVDQNILAVVSLGGINAHNALDQKVVDTYLVPEALLHVVGVVFLLKNIVGDLCALRGLRLGLSLLQSFPRKAGAQHRLTKDCSSKEEGNDFTYSSMSTCRG